MNTPRARVFVSCGQATAAERLAAAAISEELSKLGFDPYVAVQEQSLRGLKENIFARLSDSEYFLFVDFQREKLPGSEKHRGSLFSHQELAIASYLDLQFMGFQQEGVRLEGVMSFLQGNCVASRDPSDLPRLVHMEVGKRGWRTDWQNKLEVERDPGEYQDAALEGIPDLKPTINWMARFFHLKVMNRSSHRTGLGCRAYIRSIAPLYTDDPKASINLSTAPVELKWAGYPFPEVIIPPLGTRNLDAGFVLHQNPSMLEFPSFSDSSYYRTNIKGPGRFAVEFVVISENFPEVRFVVDVTLGPNLQDVRVERQQSS